ADTRQLLKGLADNTAFRLTMTASYLGKEFTLDSMTFVTDGAYVIIRSNTDLLMIQRNPFGNYLVVEDFEHNISSWMVLRGKLDFQGHVITRTKGVFTDQNYNLLIGTIAETGEVRNLVYDIPAEASPSSPIFYNIQGTLENVILRTLGPVYMESEASYGLLADYVEGSGVLRNFILKLGGDVHLRAKTGYRGVLMNRNLGLVENGYVYSAGGGAALLLYAGDGFSGAMQTGLFSELYPRSVTRNIYMLYDTWISGAESNNSAAWFSINYSGASNMYGVGDFYSMPGRTKTNGTPYTYQRATYYQTGFGALQNAYFLSSRKYTVPAQFPLNNNTTSSSVRQADLVLLRDAAWQQSVLGGEIADGGGFDIQSNVEMGFYPRLKLPAVMAKYQDYITLSPLLSSEAPVLIDDGWGADAYATHGNDAGYITLRFRNDTGASINSVAIEGLTVGEIMQQGRSKDGLYSVTLSVKVDMTNPSYASRYAVKSFTYSSGGGGRTAASDYVTKNIEFWKELRAPADWANIDGYSYTYEGQTYAVSPVTSLTWNYRLMSNINFSDDNSMTPAKITIDGSATNGGTGYFTGKIDGNGYELQNIKIENMSYPYVIYYLAASAERNGEVRNLVIRNMTISATQAPRDKQAGFIRSSMTGTVVDNVHIRDSKVTGTGQFGLLAGFSGSYVKNSSAADSAVYDSGGNFPVDAGGLIGRAQDGQLISCYTRDVQIVISDSASVTGVGGLAGHNYRTMTADCYTDGKITATGGVTGGVFGYMKDSNTVAQRVFSNVELDVTGNKVGGIVGYTEAFTQNTLAVGNIMSTGADTHRTIGYVSDPAFAGVRVNSYAYNGQIVNQMAGTDADGVKGLLTGGQLARQDIWLNK
ncbi:MAG: hypothetical protein LBK23_03325, partial [Oscillospiraceae bacterium]|nr:hypothetical protein [Oscillospiraceae bacterium]